MEIEDVLPQRDLSEQQQQELHEVRVGCQNVLEDLNQELAKYTDLSGDTKNKRGSFREVWQRLR